MTPYRTHFAYRTCVYGILFIFAILPALLAVKNIGISPDGMMYALVSEEIKSGNGIRLPMVYSVKDTFEIVDGTVPFVLEPPLVPMLLALLGGVTPQSYFAAQTLNVISHAAIAFFSFLIMKKIYDNEGIALLAGILVSFSFPVLKVTHYILSDPFCIALTAAVIYFLTLSRDAGQHQFNRNLFFASICTSASVLARSAGVSLIPVFLWGTFILVKNKSIKLKRTSTILTVILPLITTAVLFTRTFILSGSIHGWIAPSPDRSYLDAFTGTVKMTLLQFKFGERPIALISIFSIMLFLYVVLNKNIRRELSRYVYAGLDLVFVFVISHTALVTHAMAKSQTVFELRYMAPLVPFLFIFSILMIVIARDLIRGMGFSKISFCVLIVSLSIITFGNFYKTYLNSGAFSSQQRGHDRILNSPTYNWIKENYEGNVIITSNRPYHLSFFGGYSTIRLPHRRFNKNYRIPDNMESFLPSRMSHFGSRVLALFEQADERYEGSYIAGLFHKRREDDNFTVAHEFSDGVVYNLKE